MTFFDAHMHFQAPAAAPAWDLACCGVHPGQWAEVRAWAARDARIRPCLGMHPWWLRHAEPGWAEALEEALRGNGAAVGECGLDEAMREADSEAQMVALRVHLRLARELRRPLVLHVVRAWGRLDGLLTSDVWPERVMVHAFSGSPEVARALNRRGFYLSFAPLGHRSPRIRAAMAACDPALRLLESDASDPEGQRAFPEWVAEAAKALSLEPEALAEVSGANARRYFEGVRA